MQRLHTGVAISLGALMVAGIAVPASAQQLPVPTMMTPQAVQQVAEARAKPTPRGPDGKPVLTSLWTTPGDFMMKGSTGQGNVTLLFGPPPPPPGQKPAPFKAMYTPPPPDGPKYKPQYVEKVRYNDLNEPKVDKVFRCGRAGVPRILSPHQIIQSDGQVVFLYVDVAGQTFRVIPTDGRSFRKDVDATYNGDSVGHWEGDTLVVDTQNFVDDTWFGERGYLHSDKMTVRETLKREGDTLVWNATVTDPEVLLEPWTMRTRTLVVGHTALDEPPPCEELIADHLVNTDSHQQR